METILLRLGINTTETTPLSSNMFSEGISLTSHKKELVSLGVVKKSITKHFDLKQEILFANFEWDTILGLLGNKSIVYKEISKYPEVKRDFALLLNEAITFKEVYEIGFKTERKLLTNIALFDVYQGKKLPEGKKSYAVSFTLQDSNGTLTDKQIDRIMSKLQNNYERELGAELR